MEVKLNKKDISEYRNSGILKLTNFFDKDEILTLKDNLVKKIKKKNSFDCYYEKLNKKKYLRRIEKLSKNSKPFYNLLNHKDLISILRKLSRDKSFLFKDKLNFKYPNSKGFNHHIDGHWYWYNKKKQKEKGWKKYGDKFMNVVIPLEDVFLKNGCLYLSSKQLTKKFLGSKWHEITQNLVNKKSLLKKFKYKAYPLKVGDILIFDWQVSHYSKTNNSKKSRMIIYATFTNKKNQMRKYYLDKKYSQASYKEKVFF